MHTTIARVIALAAATLLVVPATALARGGHDDPAPAAAVVPAGQDDQTSETEGAGQSTDGAALEHAGGDDASPGADDSAGTGQEGAHGHGRHGRRSQDVRASKRFDLRGTVISADASAETVVITVTKANHNGRGGRALVGRTLVLDVSSARLDVADVNGDGQSDLTDVAGGDHVDAGVTIGVSPSEPLVAQRLRDRHAH